MKIHFIIAVLLLVATGCSLPQPYQPLCPDISGRWAFTFTDTNNTVVFQKTFIIARDGDHFTTPSSSWRGDFFLPYGYTTTGNVVHFLFDGKHGSGDMGGTVYQERMTGRWYKAGAGTWEAIRVSEKDTP